MRSILIIASMALAILAAPVPAPEDQVPSRRNLDGPAEPIEMLMDKRYQRLSNDKSVASDPIRHNSRSMKDGEEKKGVEKRIFRWGNDGPGHTFNGRSVENEEEDDGEDGGTPQLYPRILRPDHRRSVEDGDEVKGVEKRALRPHEERALRPHEERALRPHEERALRPHEERAFRPHDTRSDMDDEDEEDEEDEEEVEKRAIRHLLNDNNKRNLRGNQKSKRLEKPIDGRGIEKTRGVREHENTSGGPVNEKRGRRGKTPGGQKHGN